MKLNVTSTWNVIGNDLIFKIFEIYRYNLFYLNTVKGFLMISERISGFHGRKKPVPVKIYQKSFTEMPICPFYNSPVHCRTINKMVIIYYLYNIFSWNCLTHFNRTLIFTRNMSCVISRRGVFRTLTNFYDGDFFMKIINS